MPRQRINAGLLFLFSLFLPSGANYMYMGLVKRGIAAMCGFFLLIYLISASFGALLPFQVLLGFVFVIYWFAIFFDGFHIRRRINDGEYIEDGVGDILAAALRNKVIVMAFFVVIALALLSFIIAVLSVIAPVLLIILVLYIIFRRKG